MADRSEKVVGDMGGDVSDEVVLKAFLKQTVSRTF